MIGVHDCMALERLMQFAISPIALKSVTTFVSWSNGGWDDAPRLQKANEKHLRFRDNDLHLGTWRALG
jgi:hypothetical protein